jgi:hypothetical protein
MYVWARSTLEVISDISLKLIIQPYFRHACTRIQVSVKEESRLHVPSLSSNG